MEPRSSWNPSVHMGVLHKACIKVYMLQRQLQQDMEISAAYSTSAQKYLLKVKIIPDLEQKNHNRT